MEQLKELLLAEPDLRCPRCQSRRVVFGELAAGGLLWGEVAPDKLADHLSKLAGEDVRAWLRDQVDRAL